MSNVLMSLGLFVFEIPSLTYGEIQQSLNMRFAQNERIGAMAAIQFVGPGNQSITLSGVTAYGIQDDQSAFDDLTDMMVTGQAWPLVDGGGNVLGDWIIENMDRRGSMIDADGRPRRTDWTLSLTRAPDNAPAPEEPEADPDLSIEQVFNT